jgi:hypothetical protein
MRQTASAERPQPRPERDFRPQLDLERLVDLHGFQERPDEGRARIREKLCRLARPKLEAGCGLTTRKSGLRQSRARA